MLRIGIVAGESSGDNLGAGLIRAIRNRIPDAQFEGVAGPAMIAAGCKPLANAEDLAVMGITEVITHLPRLLRIRRRLLEHFFEQRPDIFVGIDAPDFNIGLEARLHQAGVPTVHYVSPSIWAWRSRRVFKIGKATDLVLTLLPFETALYEKHGYAAKFVGHPLADQAPKIPDRVALRKTLHLPFEGQLVGLLPGSRLTEVERLGPLFLETAQWLLAKMPELNFVIPAATLALSKLIKQQIRTLKPDLPVLVVDGHARDVMGVVDAALIASGTATLEAMLWRCPMVVAYRVAASSYALVQGLRLLRIQHVSLPNLLADREIVPEFLQYRALPSDMGAALLRLLQDPAARSAQLESFDVLGRVLRRQADERAAQAILELLTEQPTMAG
ncbi:MAG: lipid-A-disaccharide synthase [Gammaproteobacteria bacterium]